MWMRAVSHRRTGPWMQGSQGVVHPDTHELCVAAVGMLGVHLAGRDGQAPSAWRVRL